MRAGLAGVARSLPREAADGPGLRGRVRAAKREIETIDDIVNTLDGLCNERGLSRAELARTIGKHSASVRRLLTAGGNPELRTVVAIAEALGAELSVVPRK